MENNNAKGNWRAKLPSDSRQRVINRMVDKLKEVFPFAGEIGLQKLNKVAFRVEERIFSTATSQSDYIQKIYQKTLTIKNKVTSQNASHSMQRKVHNQDQFPILLQANQSQGRQCLIAQNMQSNMTSTGTQTSIHNASRQNPRMENIISVPRNSVSNAVGQNVPANVYAHGQQQMPRKPVVLQQQPKSQKPESLYQQQMIMKQKLQQGNLSQKAAQHHMQPNQLKSCQQSDVQTTSVMQPSSFQLSTELTLPRQQSGAASVTAQPIERLINAEKSMSPDALSAAVTDISSVMIDRIPGPDGAHHGSDVTSASGKSSVAMPPIERLIKVVKSMSPNALSAAVHDISSAICTIDRIPEPAPVNGTTVGAHCGFPTTSSGESNVTEQPIDRLIRMVKSMSPDALNAAVNDICSVMVDRIAESGPFNVSEDLAAMTNCCLQATNIITQGGITGTRKRNRYTSAMPETFDMATATSSVKRPRIEANHLLLEEIRDINQKLVDTVVDISNEDIDRTAAAAVSVEGEGTVVTCSFSAVALCPSLKSQYSSAQMSRIQPLRLLVPSNYPNSSPLLLDKIPSEVSKEYEDLSLKTKSRISTSLQNLSQVMSIAEIARTWDVCAHAVVSEHAQQSGGGTFSSKFGTWENCAASSY